MTKTAVILVVICLSQMGCSPRLKRPENLPEFSKHTYVIKTLDSRGKPVANAEFSVKRIDLSTVWNDSKAFHKTTKIKSDATGEAAIEIKAQLTQHWKGGYYSPISNIEIDKQKTEHTGKDVWGYFTELTVTDSLGKESTKSTFTQSDDKATIPYSITVSTIDDFYCQDFSRKLDEASREAIRSVAGGIIWPTPISVTNSGSLKLQGVCHGNFKGKEYISIDYQSNRRFYESKNNNYEIGVQVFDDIVRPALNPALKLMELLKPYGFKISINAKKYKSIESGSSGTPLNYEFYIPSELIRQYKNSDITGQKLINGSVVMFNNERVDLELR